MIRCPICGNLDNKIYVGATLDSPSKIVFGYKWSPEVRKTLEMRQCSSCLHVYINQDISNISKYYQDVKDEIYLSTSDIRISNSLSVLKILRKIGRAHV